VTHNDGVRIGENDWVEEEMLEELPTPLTDADGVLSPVPISEGL